MSDNDDGLDWLGNMYHKLETAILESDLMAEEAINYVESHLQKVGDDVRQLLSDIKEDVLGTPVHNSMVHADEPYTRETPCIVDPVSCSCSEQNPEEFRLEDKLAELHMHHFNHSGENPVPKIEATARSEEAKEIGVIEPVEPEMETIQSPNEMSYLLCNQKRWSSKKLDTLTNEETISGNVDSKDEEFSDWEII